jgi:predicted P-loop ATPase/GTPase
MAGLLVAPDMDAYNWMKSRVSARFFNTHVVRIVYVSARTRI